MSLKRRLYDFCNRNWWQIHLAVILATLAVLAFVLTGCGWNSQTRTVTHEKVRATGTVAGLPADMLVERVTETNSQEQGETDTGIMQALGQGVTTALQGGSNLATGGAAGLAIGLLGMGVTYLQKRKADAAVAVVSRQRDEVIDGVERAKDKLPVEAWGTLTAALEAEQSRDTVAVVKGRTQ